jgi:hypothetical protein
MPRATRGLIKEYYREAARCGILKHHNILQPINSEKIGLRERKCGVNDGGEEMGASGGILTDRGLESFITL